MDRTFLWLSVMFYAAGMVLTFRRLQLGAGSDRLQGVNHATMLAGFVLQTFFLYLRGQAVQRCPLTNTFEVTVFIAWGAALFYLLIGPAYRLSFLGAFTAPLEVALLLIGLGAFADTHAPPEAMRSAWVELHAAIAILAYGAFGLAAVVSAMYLSQERQLKRRQLNRSFLLLPSMEQLDQINARLLLMGFALLTAGMIGGFVSYEIIGHAARMKVPYAVMVWLVYAALSGSRWFGPWRGRRAAVGSIAAFALVLVAFWGIRST